MKKITTPKGFALLYAVLITSVVLMVGVAMINILTRQLVYSSLNKGSQVAYYVANSGRECLKFYDKYEYFVGRTYQPGNPDPVFTSTTTSNITIKCQGNLDRVFTRVAGTNNFTSQYDVNTAFSTDKTGLILSIEHNISNYNNSSYFTRDCVRPAGGTFQANCRSVIISNGSNLLLGSASPRKVNRTAVTVQ